MEKRLEKTRQSSQKWPLWNSEYKQDHTFGKWTHYLWNRSGDRVNYRREFPPGALREQGQAQGARATRWQLNLLPPGSCFLGWPRSFQHRWQPAFQVPGPSGGSLPNPMIHLLFLPSSGHRLLKFRGKSLGKQLSSQIRVLWFEAGSPSARRQAVWSQEQFPRDQMWEMDMFFMLNWTHTC